MKKLVERLLAASLIATVVFASGDTMANLVATITAAGCTACCGWKLRQLECDD